MFVLFAMQNTDTFLFNDSNFIFKTLLVFFKISERTLSFTFQLKEKREHFIPVNFNQTHVRDVKEAKGGGGGVGTLYFSELLDFHFDSHLGSI